MTPLSSCPKCLRAALVLAPALGVSSADAVEEPLASAEVREGILNAVVTMHRDFARHGGYVWTYDPTGMIRAGEGPAGENAAWVQPPGTPAVGEAFLKAWKATGDPRCREAALAAADSLVKGQLHSGGWNYRIEYEPALRKRHDYRIDAGPVPEAGGPPGWETWKKRRNRGNRSMLDDDTTQAALRFLLRAEAEFGASGTNGEFGRAVADAIDYGLLALRRTQYPVGAWSHNFDSLPAERPSAERYPILEAGYPESWSRTWPKAWDGCYHLNDDITTDTIRTLLLAYELLGDERALRAAKDGGEFLIRAQMPDPQPAWAQQYDKRMHPVWERKFEPPAITGGESQGAIETLMELYRVTKEKRFLEPIPKALAYLKASEISPGKLARYYELKTNTPLYFTRDYRLTYDGDDVPDHYAFTVSSRVDRLAGEFKALRNGEARADRRPPSDREISKILAAANEKGVWLEPGTVRDENGKKVRPEGGILSSRTFADNLTKLSRWLAAQ